MGSGWFRVRWQIWGDDITWTSWNRTSIPQFFRFQHSTRPPTPICVSCFPTPKSHRDKLCHPSPLPAVLQCMVSMSAAILPYFPLSPHASSEEVSVPTRVPRHPSPLNTPAVTPTKVHLFFFWCVSRLWGNNKHPKKFLVLLLNFETFYGDVKGSETLRNPEDFVDDLSSFSRVFHRSTIWWGENWQKNNKNLSGLNQ